MQTLKMTLLQVLMLVGCMALAEGVSLKFLPKRFQSQRVDIESPWPPKFCNGLACPKYTVAESYKDKFEVRNYAQSHWVSTNTAGISYSEATTQNFMRLFNYISGKNTAGVKIDMTAPVITRILPGQGPACENNFTMSFFVTSDDAPQPTNKEVYLQTFPPFRAFVRSFGGYHMDSDKAWLKEATKLAEYLSNTTYSYNQKSYFIGGYDSPFKFINRHNEVWFIAE